MDINSEFEGRNVTNIKALQRKLTLYFGLTIDEIYSQLTSIAIVNEIFTLNDYPKLNAFVNKKIAELNTKINTLLFKGIDRSFGLSTEKNFKLVVDKYGKVSSKLKQVINEPQNKAVEQFKNRKIRGLNLSDRVWNYSNQFKNEIEQHLFVGLQSGKSANELATEMKKYLKEPDKLFRRVRDSKGNLVLSKEAKMYKPGRGVYRSSFKNAQRLTRNIINNSYREAEILNYRRLPFVLGYEVVLSNSHKTYDICDVLQGKYPKTFMFRQWHVNCMCYTKSILADKSEYEKYENALLEGKGKDFKFNNYTAENPKVNEYLKDNADMLGRLKTLPTWITDNNLKV